MIVEIKVPAFGESVTEATLASWLVNDGDYVEMDQSICELESDKATFEVPAEKAGVIKIIVEADTDVEIGVVIGSIDTSAAPAAVAAAPAAESASAEAAKPAAPATPGTPAAPSNGESYAAGHPSPAAAKLIAEHKLDAAAIAGTGRDGRILKEDVERAIANGANGKSAAKAPAKSSPAAPAAPVTANAGFSRETSSKKMSRLRKTIAGHLVNAKNNTAMLTTFNEVDLTEVIALRKQYKEIFKEKHGIGLGFMSFFIKASATALMDFPAVNAQIDGENIVTHDFVDVSIAVSTPKGLVVPVIRNAESLNLAQIEKAVYDLAVKGRDNKLTMEEMTGGTFTVSNGGIFGSLQSTPIINAPQSAILGMHKIQKRPMVMGDEIVARPMMYLALSYDHRIIDGKEAVTFLVRIKELLEEPMKLFLEI